MASLYQPLSRPPLLGVDGRRIGGLFGRHCDLQAPIMPHPVEGVTGIEDQVKSIGYLHCLESTESCPFSVSLSPIETQERICADR